jgi:hypothetical protein
LRKKSLLKLTVLCYTFSINSGLVDWFHKLVKYGLLMSGEDNLEEKQMRQIPDKDRKQIESKLAVVFRSEINGLSTELRDILLDDMVTAFENRLYVLNRVSGKVDN